MVNFSIFLLALLFHSSLNCQSRSSRPSKEPEISLYRDTDEDVKNLQSASEILREVSKTITVEDVRQFFGRTIVKIGAKFFGDWFLMLGKLFGIKTELQAEVEKATELIIAEILSLHHSLHHQTHQLKAYMDKLNFKDTVVVPLTVTSRAMHNFIKKQDLSTKEELINMCRQYPPNAVAVHITQHAFDLLTNLYKSSEFDGPLYDELSSLLLKYFYIAESIYFFQLGVQYTGSDSAGASEGARENFLKDQNLLEQKIRSATDKMHIDFVSFFNSSVETEILMPLTMKHAFEKNEQIAQIVHDKLRTKYNWRHFVVIVTDNYNVFEEYSVPGSFNFLKMTHLVRGHISQHGGLCHQGAKDICVFLSSTNYHERFQHYSKLFDKSFSILDFDGNYFWLEEGLRPQIVSSDWSCAASASYSNGFFNTTTNWIPDYYLIF